MPESRHPHAFLHGLPIPRMNLCATLRVTQPRRPPVKRRPSPTPTAPDKIRRNLRRQRNDEAQQGRDNELWEVHHGNHPQRETRAARGRIP